MRIVINLIYILSCLGIVFPVNVFGAQIEIQRDMNFRISALDKDGKPTLARLGKRLSKGDILEIPDEFVIKNNSGAVNVNQTLNNWIQKEEMRLQMYDKNGVTKSDYFFPIKVINSKNKEQIGQTGYVALRTLALQDGIRFKSIEDTTIITNPVKTIKEVAATTYQAAEKLKNAVNEQVEIQNTEANVCLDGSCSNDPPPITKLKNNLSDILKKLQARENEFNKNHDPTFQGLKNNFKKSCFGLDFDQFKDFLIQKSSEKNIPPEIMLGIMTQESAGLCRAIGDKKATSKSVGLFQLNTKSVPGIYPCSSKQLEKLNSQSLSQMESDSSLRCLENPTLNLSKALDILTEKYKIVNKRDRPNLNSWSKMSEQEQDYYRKALAAYNGGQGYVLQASRDVSAMAAKFGINLDRDDWETRRLFFFRQVLEQNGSLNTTAEFNRSLELSIDNIAYTESIGGRRQGRARVAGFIDEWENLLYKPEQ